MEVLTATLGCLIGQHGLNKRGVEDLAADLLDAPIALGRVSKLLRMAASFGMMKCSL